MTGQFLLVPGALLMFANVALGEGTYQRTRNGKTLVWNNHPKPVDEATWSGTRNQEGYARGFGTLAWYKKQSRFARLTLYARYFGNMDGGKFNGPVTVHSTLPRAHAVTLLLNTHVRSRSTIRRIRFGCSPTIKN